MVEERKGQWFKVQGDEWPLFPHPYLSALLLDSCPALAQENYDGEDSCNPGGQRQETCYVILFGGTFLPPTGVSGER